MKKCLTLFALLLQLQLFSQVNYQHYLNYSVKWTRTFSAAYHWEEHNYYITGDTVLSAEQYYKVFDNWHTYDTYSGTAQHNSGNSYSMAIREDSLKRFWRCNSYDTAAYLWYDFKILPTDSLLGSAIISLDTIYFNGEPRQRFRNETNNIIIEGIGIADTRTSFSSLADIMHCFFKDTALYSYDGNCYIISSVDEQHKTDFKIYPNPGTDVLFVEAEENIATLCVTDITGRTLIAKTLNTKNFSVDISLLLPGVYFVSAAAGNKQEVKKLTVR